MVMPKYYSSKYYNKKTGILSDKAPEELKEEFEYYKRPYETKGKDKDTIKILR